MTKVRVSYDRHEGRRDRRYPLPLLTIVIDEVEYVTTNWSLGGFLLAAYTVRAHPGQKLSGILRLHDHVEPNAFDAVVVRIDEPGPGNLAAQFVELPDRTVTLLDRAIARRLFRR
jgi:hypothetical protein